MKKAIAIVLICFLCSNCLAADISETIEDELLSTDEKPKVKAVVIVCEGTIDDGLFRSIKRRAEMAIDSGADYLIFEIDTYGGLLESADEISQYLILDLGRRVRTVAYVVTKAISAGALISVSCQDIVMLKHTTIGDCAPVSLTGPLEGVEREKAESPTRAMFDRAAEANGYPKAWLRAMVSIQLEVYEVKNIQTGEYEYFNDDTLPSDANNYDLNNKKIKDTSDKIVTVESSDAVKYGIARAEVNSFADVIAYLEKRDNVEFAGDIPYLKTTWSEELVRWLNSPTIMGVLVMIALLGVYLELSSPGVGLPGLVAVISVVIILGSKYITGLANWLEIIMLITGVILLLIELLALPGFGIVGGIGIVLILAGILGMLVGNEPFELPIPKTEVDWYNFKNGVYGLLIGLFGFSILAWLAGKYLPKLEFMSGLILVPAGVKGGTMKVSMTHLPGEPVVELKVGDRGVVTNKLRPTGKARFGDAIVDVVATAEFINTGEEIKIIKISGNRVVVRQVKK